MHYFSLFLCPSQPWKNRLDKSEWISVYILKLILEVTGLRPNLTFWKYLLLFILFISFLVSDQVRVISHPYKDFLASVGSKLCGGRDQESFIQVMAYCLIKSLAKWSKKKQLRGSMRSKFSFFIFFSFLLSFFFLLTQWKNCNFDCLKKI